MAAGTAGMAALLVCAASAHGAGAPTPLDECYAASATRVEVTACLHERLRASEEMLANAGEQMLREMSQLDALTGRAETVPAFESSERAFAEFREKNCGWLAARVGAGTGAGDVKLDCLIRMTRARMEDLRAGIVPRMPSADKPDKISP